jgi:hypothetical protein
MTATAMVRAIDLSTFRGCDMRFDVDLARPTARRRRVLVVAGATASAPLRSTIAAEGPEFRFESNADDAIEAALSNDFDLMLFDLGLGGIGAVATADIVRRAGAHGVIVAIGQIAPGAPFECALASPVSAGAIEDLLRTTATPSRAASVLDDDWIRRECADLAAEFLSGLPAAATELSSLSDNGDLACLAARVHALKGCAGTYGCGEVARHCAIVESRLREGSHDPETVAALVDALRAKSDD